MVISTSQFFVCLGTSVYESCIVVVIVLSQNLVWGLDFTGGYVCSQDRTLDNRDSPCTEAKDLPKQLDVLVRYSTRTL